jgi:hypothetical protein
MPDQPPLDHTMEMLRRMREETQQGFADLKRALAELTAESRIGNAHIVGLVRFEDYATSKIADLDSRLDRVEKRLQLHETRRPLDLRLQRPLAKTLCNGDDDDAKDEPEHFGRGRRGHDLAGPLPTPLVHRAGERVT